MEQPECTTTISFQSDIVQRGIAAGIASAFSSIAMNPLDVVKVPSCKRRNVYSCAGCPAASLPADHGLLPHTDMSLNLGAGFEEAKHPVCVP